MWDNGTWTYSLTFTLDSAMSDTTTQLLVFDGVKMAADVSLNGKALGFVTDQVCDLSSWAQLSTTSTTAHHTAFSPRYLCPVPPLPLRRDRRPGRRTQHSHCKLQRQHRPTEQRVTLDALFWRLGVSRRRAWRVCQPRGTDSLSLPRPFAAGHPTA